MEIIAHRGASGYAPENTLAAFRKAIQMGAKAIEFDVQMTKDGEIVVIHDYTLERTTTGKGFVMNATANEIRSYDAGSWYDKQFENEKVPLFKEVLEIIPKDVTINVEIKKIVLDERQVEKKVMEVVKKQDRLENTIFSSFDHECLYNLRNNYQVPIGVLISSNMIDPIGYVTMHDLKSYSINQSVAFISSKFVKEAHQNGLKVLCYTVNDHKIAILLEEIGIDAIFTNYPDIMLK